MNAEPRKSKVTQIERDFGLSKKPPAPSVPRDGSAVKEALSNWRREKAAKRVGKP